MAPLLKKYSIVQMFKKASFQKKVPLKEKEVCHLELSVIYLDVMKSICLILLN